MSGQVAEAGSVLSVVPVEPYEISIIGTDIDTGGRTHVRDVCVQAIGIAVGKLNGWVVTTYATALVMAPDGTLVPLRDVLAEGEEVYGHVYS